MDLLLHSAAIAVVEIASHFDYYISNELLKMEELSPLVADSLFQAVDTQSRMLQRTSDTIYVRRYDALVNMLKGFNKRWNFAGELCTFSLEFIIHV